MQPVKIRLTSEKELTVKWDDSTECVYSLSLLRRKCPCAACRKEYQPKGAKYIPLFTRDALTIESVQPVGHYALQFRWKDGHDTGIYTYEYLRDLCPGK